MSGQDAIKELLAASEAGGFINATAFGQALGFPVFEFLADCRRRRVRVRGEGAALELERNDAIRVYIDGADALNPAPSWSTSGGGVYFVRCESFIKIGVARHLETRLAVFALNNPYEIKVLLFLKTASQLAAYKLESSLHRRFAPHHHRGEWFRDCPEIGAFITTESHR